MRSSVPPWAWGGHCECPAGCSDPSACSDAGRVTQTAPYDPQSSALRLAYACTSPLGTTSRAPSPTGSPLIGYWYRSLFFCLPLTPASLPSSPLLQPTPSEWPPRQTVPIKRPVRVFFSHAVMRSSLGP